MSLLLDDAALLARRAVARGALAPLANGLRDELQPMLTGAIDVPRDKALLTRVGGRCPRDGTMLRFDPLDARHLCPVCGVEVSGELHDRFRPYWYQLWLAERVLHAALLGALLEDDACTAAAWDVLDAYADRYLQYPNRDNVLGPSRPFFSTYLESIWLLQLVLALDLLESRGPSADARAGRVRDRLVEPSVRLVASYDERLSNRQVWNDAAMLAAGRLLGDDALVDRAIDGPSGLGELTAHALLADGSWYEGENYHLFAHRGLWYGVTMAERLGRGLGAELTRRFDEGFAAPFRTVLPDLTYPSRRDSQYAVSVRQPRFAESCELGLARRDDPRLVGMLARLYDPAVPRRDSGRRAATADVERNTPATGLARADLSWRALLFARPALPPLEAHALGSDLLPAQGIGILRRDAGRCYVALDYGRSGGGHGHPDRLNLLLSDGERRWFDDPGTGSYVEESLHWYRSTLAHVAPLVDGRSQPRIDGVLAAFDDRGNVGWMRAQAELAPDCTVHRSVVVLGDYLVDRIEWSADREREIALPLHGVQVVDPVGIPIAATPAPMPGGVGREDGFAFLRDTARLEPSSATTRLRGELDADQGSARIDGWMTTTGATVWWTARAPGPPGRGERPVALVRVRAREGAITAVWSWRDAVTSVECDATNVRVARADGTSDGHVPLGDAWRVRRGAGAQVVELGRGAATARNNAEEAPRRADPAAPRPIHSLPFRRELGGDSYRRSEEPWAEAGRPTCVVSLDRSRDRLLVRVDVPRAERRFVRIDAENPLDNDPAAIHGDGVQLYVVVGDAESGWLLVPIRDTTEVAMRGAEGWSTTLPVQATWSASRGGYVLSAEVQLPALAGEVAVDVLVNEIAPGRVRRRGQLVLSGAQGEFVYLRADRHERERLLRFALGRP